MTSGAEEVGGETEAGAGDHVELVEATEAGTTATSEVVAGVGVERTSCEAGAGEGCRTGGRTE